MRDPFLRTIAATIERRRLLRRRDSVLIAVSGGPDSVALLAALLSLGEGRWRIGVAHVNHRLRGADSDRDERFVVALAARLGVDCITLDGRVAPGGNLEERAREARYSLLLETARAQGYRRIATGHTLDDQAETFLLRLLRGAGARGLSGIAPARADGVIRPLLEASRKDVLSFLDRRGLRFRKDRTNADPRFTRNRVRRRLLPMLERDFNPRIREALARTAALLADEDAALDENATRRLARFLRGGRLEVGALGGSPAIARRSLRIWLERVRGSRSGPSADQVEAVLALVRSAAGGSAALPGGAVRKSGGTLRWIGRSALEAMAPRAAPLGIPGARSFGNYRIRAREERASAAPRPRRWRAVFDASALGRRLVVRAPRPGDRLRPLGLGGTKKLQDVFVDARVDRELRSAVPVVEREGEIVWVPGLVRSEVAPVTAATRRVIVLECFRPR